MSDHQYSANGHGYGRHPGHPSEDAVAPPPHNPNSLRRLQIFHPISLLLVLASFAITGAAVHPGLEKVAKWHPTYFNPANSWLLGFWAALFLLQIGTTLDIALAAGERTKALLTNGMSVSLPLANLMLAIWAPLFVVDKRPAFIAGEVALGIATLLLTWSLLVTGFKAAYSPSWKRPIEWLLIHLPLRLFLAVLVNADIWQQGMICFGLAETPHDLPRTTWPAFIIFISVGLVSAFWIFATTDLAFGLAGVYIQLAILFGRPHIADRPAEVVAAQILNIVLQSVALLASLAWGRLLARREGRIALPVGPHEEAAIAQAELEAEAAEARARTQRQEADRLAGVEGSAGAEAEAADPTPSQLERGEGHGGEEVGVTRKLGQTQG